MEAHHLTWIGFSFLTYNSVMAIYKSKDDSYSVSFILIAYLSLLLLFWCLRLVERAGPNAPHRSRLMAYVWSLCTLLTGSSSFQGSMVGHQPTEAPLPGSVHPGPKFIIHEEVNMVLLNSDPQTQDRVSVSDNLGSSSFQGSMVGHQPTEAPLMGSFHPNLEFIFQAEVNMELLNSYPQIQDGVSLSDNLGSSSLQGSMVGHQPTEAPLMGYVHQDPEFIFHAEVNMELLNSDPQTQDGVSLSDNLGSSSFQGSMVGHQPTEAPLTGYVHPDPEFIFNAEVNMELLNSDPQTQDGVSLSDNLGPSSFQGSMDLEGGVSGHTNHQISRPGHNTGNWLESIVGLALGPNQSNPIWRLRLFAAITIVIIAIVGVFFLPVYLQGVHSTYQRVMLITSVGAPIVVAAISFFVSFWLASDGQNNWITGLSVANISMLGGTLVIFLVLKRGS